MLYSIPRKHIREYVGLFNFPMPDSFFELENVLVEAADKALMLYRARYRRIPKTVMLTVQAGLGTVARILMDVSGTNPKIKSWRGTSAGNPLHRLYEEYHYLTKRFDLARYHGLKQRSKTLVSIDSILYRETAIPYIKPENIKPEPLSKKLNMRDIWDSVRKTVRIKQP